MNRTISIVLIVAMALQTVGCSTWRPLARGFAVSEDERQSLMRVQVLGKLKEGMSVRIMIREGTTTLIKSRVFECVIEEITNTTLTVNPAPSYFHGDDRKEITLRFADIVSIENRSYRISRLEDFLAGVAFGALLSFFGIAVSFANTE